MTTPMDFGDKEFEYGAGYPAPFSIPDTTVCRTFRVPADDANGEWLALVMGVMATLTDPANIVQFEGALDPEVVAQRWLEMLNDAYDRAEAGCAVLLPSGDRVFRINATTGRVEELLDDDTWGTPEGDAEIPPVPARTGGTELDQVCLAAANAVNVYSQIYETITDQISSGATDAEAWAAAIAAFVALVGAEFAPIAAALAVFFLTIIFTAIEIVRFIGADLWDDAFTKAFVCILISCANNDDGVVTFDYQCVQNALAGNTDVLDLTASQLRLFGQLMFILQATGGADGLNQAGATTAITSYDCSDCDNEWCVVYDFTLSPYDFVNVFADASGGVWTSSGWKNSLTDEDGQPYLAQDAFIQRDFSAYTLTRATVTWNVVALGSNNFPVEARRGVAYNSGIPSIVAQTSVPIAVGETTDYGDITSGGALQIIVRVGINHPAGLGDPGGEGYITKLILQGTGTRPPDGENCPP